LRPILVQDVARPVQQRAARVLNNQAAHTAWHPLGDALAKHACGSAMDCFEDIVVTVAGVALDGDKEGPEAWLAGAVCGWSLDAPRVKGQFGKVASAYLAVRMAVSRQ
jgi:hypothetical protein